VSLIVDVTTVSTSVSLASARLLRGAGTGAARRRCQCAGQQRHKADRTRADCAQQRLAADVASEADCAAGCRRRAAERWRCGTVRRQRRAVRQLATALGQAQRRGARQRLRRSSPRRCRLRDAVCRRQADANASRVQCLRCCRARESRMRNRSAVWWSC
jgi:hypothetical protein